MINNYITQVEEIVREAEREKVREKLDKKLRQLNQVGQLHVHLKGRKLGVITVMQQDVPEELVGKFLREKQVDYTEEMKNKLVRQILEIRKDYENQFAEPSREVKKNGVRLISFKLGELQQLKQDLNAFLIDASLEVGKGKVIRVQARRVCN